MKDSISFHSPFLFNPEMTITRNWPSVRRNKSRVVSRPVPLSLATETQIGYQQEFICGAIMILCVLFSLAAVIAQFALASN